ncbi:MULTISPECIES: hypothetical protein [unclassified Agrococcus]|uniref:hypothetical protein n=1 Tax=unclassified Agrococcus TaxID=2615065 RepID=UPI00360BF784
MEWLPWVVLAVGVVVIAALVPRLYRRERSRQRERGTIPGGFGVVDEAWRPADHAARLERERRDEADEASQPPREPDRVRDADAGDGDAPRASDPRR